MPLKRMVGLCLLVASLCTARQDDGKAKEEELLTAARQGNLAKVKELVDGGVAVDCKNRYGITPLFYAAWGGSEEVARFLISKGADVNIRDTFYKMNALATAISKNNEGAARALVEGGATGGEMMLGMASGRGQKALVGTILEKTKPNEGQLKNAVQSAQDANHTEIVAMLRKAGAPEPKVLGVSIAPEKLARLTGTYTAQGVGEAAAEVKEGKLYLNAMGQSMEMLAYDELNFATKAMEGARFEFVLENEKGKSIKLTGNGRNIVLNRVEGK